jgi:predicted RNase H-like HicB family nuclease/DNA-binding XRE family transcriptional regulator
MKYPGIIEKEDDGYIIRFPDLPGCHTEGDTKEELINMAKGVLLSHLEVLFDYSQTPIPEPSEIKGKNIIYFDVPPEIAIPIMLRKIRLEENLTQKDLAERINITQQTYQRIEDVRKFNATVKTLEKIVKALGKKLEFQIK